MEARGVLFTLVFEFPMLVRRTRTKLQTVGSQSRILSLLTLS